LILDDLGTREVEGGEIVNAVRTVGPLTEEGLFLLMCEMLEAQGRTLTMRTREFEKQTRIQEAYANMRNDLSRAGEAARSNGSDGHLHREELVKLFGEGRAAEILDGFDEGGDGGDGRIGPRELCQYLNEHYFPGSSEYHVTLEDGAFAKEAADAAAMLDRVDDAREAKTTDTTLLTTELSNLVNQLNRLSSMFSNMLNKLHESKMSVIRNI
jgi:hypothetical protein